MAKAPSWSPEDARVLERYVRALLRDEYPNAAQAALAYLREVDRLRNQYPDSRQREPVSAN